MNTFVLQAALSIAMAGLAYAAPASMPDTFDTGGEIMVMVQPEIVQSCTGAATLPVTRTYTNAPGSTSVWTCTSQGTRFNTYTMTEVPGSAGGATYVTVYTPATLTITSDGVATVLAEPQAGAYQTEAVVLEPITTFINGMATTITQSQTVLYQTEIYQTEVYQTELYQTELYQTELYQTEFYQTGVGASDPITKSIDGVATVRSGLQTGASQTGASLTAIGALDSVTRTGPIPTTFTQLPTSGDSETAVIVQITTSSVLYPNATTKMPGSIATMLTQPSASLGGTKPIVIATPNATSSLVNVTSMGSSAPTTTESPSSRNGTETSLIVTPTIDITTVTLDGPNATTYTQMPTRSGGVETVVVVTPNIYAHIVTITSGGSVATTITELPASPIGTEVIIIITPTTSTTSVPSGGSNAITTQATTIPSVASEPSNTTTTQSPAISSITSRSSNATTMQLSTLTSITSGLSNATTTQVSTLTSITSGSPNATTTQVSTLTFITSGSSIGTSAQVPKITSVTSGGSNATTITQFPTAIGGTETIVIVTPTTPITSITIGGSNATTTTRSPTAPVGTETIVIVTPTTPITSITIGGGNATTMTQFPTAPGGTETIVIVTPTTPVTFITIGGSNATTTTRFPTAPGGTETIVVVTATTPIVTTTIDGSSATTYTMTPTIVGATETIVVVQPTFSCDAGGYLVQNDVLYRLDLETGVNTKVSSNVQGNGDSVNAIGYNVLDNIIYGIVTNSSGNYITKIGADGKGVAVAPVALTGFVEVGDVDLDGHMWISVGGTTWEEIDVNPSSATYLQSLASGTSKLPAGQTVSDWVYLPNGGNYLYTVTTAPALVRWSMTTHTYTTLQTYNATIAGSDTFGALYASSNGTFYGEENTSGKLYNFDIATYIYGFISTGPVTTRNDGARCAIAPAPSS